ncbi:NADH:flavorubredoxin reductase NorW [Zymobacter sp. IVIA_12111.31 C1]|uniref:NADH:flavorubredoxin reductase NorW n=1 Tax=Zymobacter sp. IVIA_12111.31 C1 TaxID=3394854 RepID=UPI0039C1BF3E
MTHDIVIVGAGFAARQLVRSVRRLDPERPIRIVTADSGDEYAKPELSHVFSRGQSADDLIQQSAADFANANRCTLHAHTCVNTIDAEQRRIDTDAGTFDYGELVLATGGQAIVPPVLGHECLLTFNSRQEYALSEARLRAAEHVMVLGAGLVGTELAMDLARAGKRVTLVDQATTLLPTVLPPLFGGPLQHTLHTLGVSLHLNATLLSVLPDRNGLRAMLSTGTSVTVDEVICAVGLRPDTHLAASAGAEVRQGIVVDDQLATSVPHLHALGDAAEIGGRLWPFLQPIQLSAATLARVLTGDDNAHLMLPPMLVRVKTPTFPIQAAGDPFHPDVRWRISADADGMTAEGRTEDGTLLAFLCFDKHTANAIGLLKQLPRLR